MIESPSANSSPTTKKAATLETSAATKTERISMPNSSVNSAPEQAVPNPFDPANLRLSQDFAATVGVKKVLTKVLCRKPHKHEFVRVRASADWRVDTAVFEDSIERETYLVATELIPELVGEVRSVCLRTAINKQGDIFLWPFKLPGPDGRGNHWHESAVDAANLAEEKWVRVSANMNEGMYNVYLATGDLKEPEWPELSFAKVIELSFRDRRIDAYDHPMLKQLRGEV